MNSVDAQCAQCGQAFRWLSGTPLRCPAGHDLHPITTEQVQRPTSAEETNTRSVIITDLLNTVLPHPAHGDGDILT